MKDDLPGILASFLLLLIFLLYIGGVIIMLKFLVEWML